MIDSNVTSSMIRIFLEWFALDFANNSAHKITQTTQKTINATFGKNQNTTTKINNTEIYFPMRDFLNFIFGVSQSGELSQVPKLL